MNVRAGVSASADPSKNESWLAAPGSEEEDEGRARVPDLAAGTSIADRYTVVSVLGRGGYAVVYRARDRSTGSEIAVKAKHIADEWRD